MTETAIAYISGATAKACVVGLSESYVLRVGAELTTCDSAMVSNLLALAPDVEIMNAGSFPFHDVAIRLTRRWTEWRILDLILSSAEAIFPIKLRCRLISIANALIRQQPEAADWARERFFIAVPVDSIEILIARELARGVDAAFVVAELSCLYYTGSILHRMKKKWAVAVAAAGAPERDDEIWVVTPLALALRDRDCNFAVFSERTIALAAREDPTLVDATHDWLASLSYSWDLFRRCTRVALHPVAVMRVSRRDDRLVAWYGVSSLSNMVDLSAVRWTWAVRRIIARDDGTFDIAASGDSLSSDTRYGHDVVALRVDGAIQSCLGLSSASGSDGYVFADRRGRPIVVSPRDAIAFLCIDEAVDREDKLGALLTLVDELSLLLKSADPAVKSEAASRLYHYASRAIRHSTNRDLAVRVRAQVTRMFSWRWIDRRLEAILKKIDPKWTGRDDADDDFDDERPVPISRRLFSTLMRLSERGEVPAEWSPDIASMIVNEIWTIHPHTFPAVTRSLLIRILDRVSQQFRLTSDVRESRLDGAEVARTAIVAHLAISRLKEVDRPLLLVSRITNTARALNRMDSARFFEDRIDHLDSAMIDEITSTASLVPQTTVEFLELDLRLDNWTKEGDRLIAAGDVLRCTAQMYIDVFNNHDTALNMAKRAVMFYEHAGQYSYRHAKELYTHWAWSHALLGRLLHRQWDEALRSFDVALDKLSHPAIHAFSPYLQQIYRIDVLILRARFMPDSKAREQEVVRLIDQLAKLTEQWSDQAVGWDRLFHCYREFRGDDQAALGVLDQWLASWRGRERERGFQHVQYKAATIALGIAKNNEQLVGVALRRYVDLLCFQPRNTVAFSAFVEAFRRAPRSEQIKLETYALERLPPLDDARCELTHCAIRLIFGDGTTTIFVPSYSDVSAIVAVIHSDDATLVESAVARLRVTIAKSRTLATVLEYLTRELFEQARDAYLVNRANGIKLLMRLDLLLDVALAGKPDDVIWWTRKADIARIARVSEPVALAEALIAVAPDDPILRLKAAQLLIGQDNDRAEQILLEGDHSSPEHPATLDRLALLATLRGDFDRGAEIYDLLLERNGLDASALWGRGRVEQERHNPRGAFEYWLSLLRVRTLASTLADAALAERTAIAIANLCREEASDDVSEGVRSRVVLALWDESPAVAARLLQAMRSASIVDRAMVGAVLDVMRETNDILLRQQVARYFMASAIDMALTPSVDRTWLLDDQLPRFVIWCSARGVLGDLMFGAKGSYARSIARRTWQASEESDVFTRALGDKLPAEAVTMIGNLHAQTNDSSYYRRGYDLASRVHSLSTEHIAEYILFAIYDVARTISENASMRFALDSLVPAVGLCALHLHNDENTMSVSAFVDSAAFNTLTPAFGVNSWRVDAEAIKAKILRFPSRQENRTYGGFGIRFNHDDAGDVCSISRAEMFIA